uniref:DNA primase/polymerase bifunctional N-terminal domain-containing protein n=1 Tax=Archaeoglobus fulgidus TaxID=2234 RepID=A0A7C2NM67_ARCFL
MKPGNNNQSLNYKNLSEFNPHELRELALYLHTRGFNVVPVHYKEPIGSWSPDRRLTREELEKRLESEKLTGIAIVGGQIENEKAKNLIAVLIDVDNPLILQKTQKLAKLLEKTAVWKTGLRCPKCGDKTLEKTENDVLMFRCKNCGEVFTSDEALRGYGALVFVQKEDNIKLTTRRLKAVEILVTNYQLIPPSLHPSGVRYEWVIDLNTITVLSPARFEEIIREVERAVKGEEKEEKKEKELKASQASHKVSYLRKLSDEEIGQIVEKLKPHYKVGERQNIWLYLSGWFAKAGISPVSAAKVLLRLYSENKDDDSLKMRHEALVRSYKKAGIDITPLAGELTQLFGFEPHDVAIEDREEVKGRAGLEELIGGEICEDIARIVETRKRGFRDLSDKKVGKIVGILSEPYTTLAQEGTEKLFSYRLAEWGAVAGISPVLISEILKTLNAGTGSDPKEVIPGIIAGYRGKVDLKELEKVFNTEINLNNLEICLEEFERAPSIFELLLEGFKTPPISHLNKRKAIDTLQELENFFGRGSPSPQDPVIEEVSYDPPYLLFADRKEFEVYILREDVITIAWKGKKQKEKEKIYVKKEPVFYGAPVEVVVYASPLGEITRYRVVWKVSTRPRPIVIGPATIDEIYVRLKLEGLVVKSYRGQDYLNILIEAFCKKKLAEIKTEVEIPGVFLIDGKLQCTVKYARPSSGELEKALLLLNELANEWFGNVRPKFSRMIRWSVISPFIFAIKQSGRWIKLPFIKGDPQAGKSTMAEIAINIWRWNGGEKPGSSINTIPRFGEVIRRTTFPTLINETAPIFGSLNRDLEDVIKNAIDKTVARGRFIRQGVYEEIMAFSPLIFTTNRGLPKEEATRARFFFINVTRGDAPSEERKKEFNEKIRPRIFRELFPVGDFVLDYVMSKFKDGLPHDIADKWEELAIEILERAYEHAGLEAPDWIYDSYEERGEEEFEEELRLRIREFLAKRIDEAFFKGVGRLAGYEVVDSVSSSNVEHEFRVRAVIEKKLIPWLFAKEDSVYIMRGIIEELEKQDIEVAGGLQSLAELFKWEYIPKKSFKVGGKVMNCSVVRVDYSEFKEFVTMGVEKLEELEESEAQEPVAVVEDIDFTRWS